MTEEGSERHRFTGQEKIKQSIDETAKPIHTEEDTKEARKIKDKGKIAIKNKDIEHTSATGVNDRDSVSTKKMAVELKEALILYKENISNYGGASEKSKNLKT